MHHGYRLLAIDDEEGAHDSYRTMLFPDQEIEPLADEVKRLIGHYEVPQEQPDWSLDHAYSGREGVERVERALQQQWPYALIFLDMRMLPGMNGLETAKAIRKIDPLVRIIFVTAYADARLTEVREQIGVDFEFMHKPMAQQELLQLTQLHTERWQQLTDMESQVQQRTRDLEQTHRKMQGVLESLSREKGQFEQILEVMREGMVVVDRLGSISYLNRKMEQLCGRQDLEVHGHPLKTLFAEQYSPDAGEAFSTSVLKRVSDKLEQLLVQQQRQLRSWIDSAMVGALLLDAEGVIQLSSPAMEGVSGWRSSELIGQRLELLLPEPLRDRHAQHFTDFLKRPQPRSMASGRYLPLLHRNGQQRQVEIGLVPLQLEGKPLILAMLRNPAEQQLWELFKLTPFGQMFLGNSKEDWYTWKLRQADGSTIPLYMTGAPMYQRDDEERSYNGAVLLFHDAREIISQESLQQTQKAKEDFMATISHELRTPLSNIIGNGDLLAESPLSVDQQQLLESMRHSSQGLLTLVNDILDYSKIQSGNFRLEQRLFQLDELLNQLLQEFVPRMDAVGMTLQLVDPVPKQPLQGDPQRIRQILSNLLENARKYAARGTVVLQVRNQRTMSCALR